MFGYMDFERGVFGARPIYHLSHSLVRPAPRANQILTVEDLDALPHGTIIERVYTFGKTDFASASKMRFYGRTDGCKHAKAVHQYPGGAWFEWNYINNPLKENQVNSLADACVIPDARGQWNLWNYLRLPLGVK